MAHKLTTCTFCGVGCGLYLETLGNQVTGVYPSLSHPTNQGRLCVRGWHVHEAIAAHKGRLTAPLLRKNGKLEQVSWNEAISFIAERLQQIKRDYGPDSIAFLVSPRASNEEAYLIQKFARTLIGTNNVDHGTGVYCNKSVDVLLDMVGVAASTGSLADLSQSEVILVDEVDLFRKLPTVGGAVIRARTNGTRLIAVGIRRNRVAENADIFLQIRPETQAVLYGAMAKIIIDRGLQHTDFVKSCCTGYQRFAESAQVCDVLEAAERCGVSAESIEAAAVLIGRASRVASLFSTVEARQQSGLQALVNLMLLTGNLGKAGSGIFALTEQNNLQGVCDMGVIPDRLPGYVHVSRVEGRRRLESLWNAQLPATSGMGATEVLTNRGRGQIKALWLCRYNPVKSALFGRAQQTLSECDLVVAQHPFLTADAEKATVVLPTTLYGEEEVTFTNCERRIQLAEKVVDPPGEAIPAWQQIVRLAQSMCADWHYRDSTDVMTEIQEAVTFYSAADYGNLSREFGRQWPCTKEHPLGSPRIEDHGNGNSKRFTFQPLANPEKEVTSRGFPLTLVFGHSLYYWHQDALALQSETLRREYNILFLDYPQGFAELNTNDARELGVRDGQQVRLVAPSGTATATARVTPEIRSGTVFVPYFMADVEANLAGSAGTLDRNMPVRVEKIS